MRGGKINRVLLGVARNSYGKVDVGIPTKSTNIDERRRGKGTEFMAL